MNHVNAIVARARSSAPPPEWIIQPFPRSPLDLSVQGVFRYLFGGLFLGSFISLAVGCATSVAGWSLPSTGPAAVRLYVLVACAAWLAGIAPIVVGDLSRSLLIITDQQAVMVTSGPLRRRRTRVLEFGRMRGMAVQEVRHETGSGTTFTTHRLVLRPAHGHQETWDIGCAEATYREIVTQFERNHPNDAGDLPTVTFVRMTDD